MIKAVFFDMDGVLLDSLQAHLDFYQHMAVILGVDAKIVDAVSYKNDYARKSAKISPMVEFFRAMGFGDKADEATEYYNRDFPKIQVPMFCDAANQLFLLQRSFPGRLGIVTANTMRAVYKGLEPCTNLFPAYSIYAKDSSPYPFSKAEALETAARTLIVKTSEILYVGDQPSDQVAAISSGCQFLGVSYGWGFAEEDEREDFRLVKTPEHLYLGIMNEIYERS